MLYINSLLLLIDKGDYAFVKMLFEVRNVIFTNIFSTITSLGNVYILIILSTVMLLAMLFWKKRYDLIFPFLTTMFGSIGTSEFLKLIIERVRPDEVMWAVLETGFSMPSIHATGAMALYGFFTYFAIKESQNFSNRVWITLFGVFMIVLIGFSRIYLGVHYSSDVLMGFFVGFIWLTIGVHLRHRSEKLQS